MPPRCSTSPPAQTRLILGRSLAQGRDAGVVSALGISTGSVLDIALATFGLSAVLAQSAQRTTARSAGARRRRSMRQSSGTRTRYYLR